jgi:2-polyprenyl-6-methoxyphenol hydroxylase-like FAD-dependent oxidoreductase
MLAARVLSDHFDDVILLERYELPGTATARQGVPQARHAHALLQRGRGVMERLLPGLTEELVGAGAELMDATQDVATMCPHGWYVRCPGGPALLGASRDLIDHRVRSRVAAIPNVRIRQGVEVDGLIQGSGDRPGVGGVRLWARPAGHGVGRTREELGADLVVVADGRNSRLPDWLVALGYEPPRETVVNSFQGYASRRYRPAAEFGSDWKALYIQQAPPGDPRGGLITPVEGSLWLVSLIGGDGDYPPVDDVGFLDFARNLRSPVLYEAIAEAEPLTPIVGHRATENRLRHYDRLGRFPEGLVVMGDAACAFNPVYGQGMTAAAIGADVLDRWLRGTAWRHGPGRGQAFQHSLARATAAAWQLSTGADYGFRTVEGTPQGRFAQFTGRYLARVMRAATRRPWVMRRLAGVFHLLHPPATLFGPGVLTRLGWDRLAGETGTGRRGAGLSARGLIAIASNAAADLEVGSGSVVRGRSERGDVPSSGEAMVERWWIRNVGRPA